MWKSGAFEFGLPGAGRMCAGRPALRAEATIAVPPSQQNSAAGVTTTSGAAVIDTRFDFGSTTSEVTPRRSRATITGICSAAMPRLADLPPLLRAARGTGHAGSPALE